MKIDKELAFAAACLAGGTAILIEALHIRKREQAKRKKIQEDLTIDLEAIRRASNNVQSRMNYGPYVMQGLGYIMDDFKNEVEFQKIAIRED